MNIVHFTHPLSTSVNGFVGAAAIDTTIRKELQIPSSHKYEILSMSQSIYSDGSTPLIVTTLIVEVTTK